MQISAYYINELGLLMYSGLPVTANDINSSHFNGKKYHNEEIIPKYKTQYEVYGSTEFALLHSLYGAKLFGLRYILLQNCYRVI